MTSAWQWNGEGTLVREEARRSRKTASSTDTERSADAHVLEAPTSSPALAPVSTGHRAWGHIVQSRILGCGERCDRRAGREPLNAIIRAAARPLRSGRKSNA
jgi:hypothetical protein